MKKTKKKKNSQLSTSVLGLPRLLHALRLRDALGRVRPRPLLQAHLHPDPARRLRVRYRVLPGELRVFLFFFLKFFGALFWASFSFFLSLSIFLPFFLSFAFRRKREMERI